MATEPILTHECYCGAAIRKVDGEYATWWINTRGDDRCYPDSPEPYDAAAMHEPFKKLVVSDE